MRAPLFFFVLLSLLAGCGSTHFELRSPDDFLVLSDERRGPYAFTATSADGIRLAVREESNEGHGSQAFWEQAVRNQLRFEGGYAIASEAPLRAASGHAGTLFRCGKDQHGRAYDYWLAVFTTDERVFVLEAGGPHAQFEPAAAEVEASFATFRID